MANKTYLLSDGRVKVTTTSGEDADFHEELKRKNLTAINYEEPENQIGSTIDTNVEQKTSVSNQGVNQPQNNQQENTESTSGDSSLVSYTLNGKIHTIPKKNVVSFEKKNPDAEKIDDGKKMPWERGEFSKLMEEYADEVRKDENLLKTSGGAVLDQVSPNFGKQINTAHTYLGAYSKFVDENGNTKNSAMRPSIKTRGLVLFLMINQVRL